MAIFVGLIAANLLLFAIAGALGIWFFTDANVGVDRHVLLSVLALLLSCLIQVAAFTYLTVTGKVLSQAIHLGSLPLAHLDAAKSIKRKFTGCLGLCFSTIVLVTATGAAAWRGGKPSAWHWLAAALTVVVHLWVWFRQYFLLKHNADVMTKALAQFDDARSRAKTSRLPP